MPAPMSAIARHALALATCLLLGLTGAHGQQTGAATGTTLADFFTAALGYSPRLKIAEENLNITSARKQAATGQLLPQVSVSGSVSENRQITNTFDRDFSGERLSVQLTQVLFNWQAFAARRRASAVESQAEAEYYFELATLLTTVAERYFNVLQAQDALRSIASELDAVDNQLQQIQSRYDRQLARITDLYQAQASVAAVRAEQLRLQSELALTQEQLRAVSGLEVGRLYTLDDAAEVPGVEESIQYWVNLARENNQQIRAREMAVDAAEERISENRGRYLPQVSFNAQAQDSNQGFDNVFIGDTETTFIGVTVSVPLYAGGSNRAAVREARSARNIAENELLQTELEADERVRTAYMQIQSNQTLTEAAESLLESATLSAEAMREGFDLGVVTSVDVLNALRDQFQAERDLQRARYEHIKNLLVLKREAGTLAAEDMLEVGTWLEPPAQ